MNRLGAPESLPAIQPAEEHADRDVGAPRSRGSWSQCRRNSEGEALHERSNRSHPPSPILQKKILQLMIFLKKPFAIF